MAFGPPACPRWTMISLLGKVWNKWIQLDIAGAMREMYMLGVAHEIEEALQAVRHIHSFGPFLISMLRCLGGNDEDPVGEGVYPMSFEEVVLFLANQTGFGFPFWNSATKSMDILPLCSRYTKPTLAYVVQAVRKVFCF